MVACPAMAPGPNLDRLPDVRDGLTRVERVVLWQLLEEQKDFGTRRVSPSTLYGRVVEHVNISVPEFHLLLQRRTGSAP